MSVHIVFKKTFSVKGYLIGHERTHTGDKSYQCKFCKKGFSQKGNLNEHDSTHTGENCLSSQKICEKRFSVEGYLTRHERTHTGDKSYQCKFCKKGFSQKGN